MSGPTVEVVGYGRPATAALAETIDAAKTSHPLDPVTVIVASNLSGLSARRLVGGGNVGGTGFANVSFVTPFRLAELLGGRARRWSAADKRRVSSGGTSSPSATTSSARAASSGGVMARLPAAARRPGPARPA